MVSDSVSKARSEDLAISMVDAASTARKRQRIRSIAIGWALFGLAVLFFAATVVRLTDNMAILAARAK